MNLGLPVVKHWQIVLKASHIMLAMPAIPENAIIVCSGVEGTMPSIM